MKIKACRICQGKSLQHYLDLGFTPPADSFIAKQGLEQGEVYYPLAVCLCLDCGISQLVHTVPPDILYQHDYPYESSMTLAGHNHFSNFAASVVNRFKIGSGRLVVDVGSNVGVLLDAFKNKGCRVLGIDPSANIAEIAIGRGVETINDFISPQVASQIVECYGKASVVTATNVFAHIDDLDSFMEAINLLLNDTGVLIVEAPHFLKLVENLEYDTVYHEHLMYISVKPLNRLFGRFGYEVFDVEEVGIHGGSIRIYVSRTGLYQTTVALGKLIEAERISRIFDIGRLQQFSKDVASHRLKLATMLRSLKAEGASLAGVSAPAKGMTLLNYCRLGPELLDFVTEKSRLKIGRYTPGMHIPVLSDAALMERRPDYALLLAWNFADEIMENLKEYRSKGGKFIIPIPEPRIV